jgi:hypothetical protein
MTQPTLFDPGEIVLTDGERGRTFYVPRFVDPATADPVGERISLAFRVKRQRRDPAASEGDRRLSLTPGSPS